MKEDALEITKVQADTVVGNVVVPTDPEAKKEWCEYGEKVEDNFVLSCFRGGIGVSKNVTKVCDKYAADLLATIPADLKVVRTPLFTASRWGFNPNTTLTLNVEDVEKYKSSHPVMLIFFSILWDEQTRVFGGKSIPVASANTLRICFLPSLFSMIQKNKLPKITYRFRTQDRQGNSKESYLLNYEWFYEVK